MEDISEATLVTDTVDSGDGSESSSSPFILHVNGTKDKIDFTTWPLYFPDTVQALFYVVIADDCDVIKHQLVELPKNKKELFLEVRTSDYPGSVIMHVVGLIRIGEGVQAYYKVVAESFLDITDGEEKVDDIEEEPDNDTDDTPLVELKSSEGGDIADVLFGFQDEEGPDVLLSHKHGSKYWVRTPPGRTGLCTQKLILLQQIQNKQLYLMFTNNSWNFKSVPFMLQPGREYRCLVLYSSSHIKGDDVSNNLHITATTDSNNNDVVDEFLAHQLQQASKVKVSSIYFTKQELESLRLKAIEFVHRRKQRCVTIPYFYRNKDLKYFQDIMRKCNGVMYPLLKDNNGDRYSIVNNNIEGIFFSALILPRTLKPPETSIFGTRRYYIKSSLLLNDSTNMYFADFYCYNNVVHYVTIVLTKPGSEPDEFCSKNLIQLDTAQNPFLQLTLLDDGEYHVTVTMNVVVEVFYTEPIDLFSVRTIPGASFLEDVKVVGRGSSIEGGIPKKDDCELCNVRMS